MEERRRDEGPAGRALRVSRDWLEEIGQQGSGLRHGLEPFHAKRTCRTRVVVALYNSDPDRCNCAGHLIVFNALCDEAKSESIDQRDD